MFLGIFVVNAVDAGGLGDDLGVDFEAAQRGRRIGGEVRIRCSGGEDDGASFFEMTNGPAANIGLGHLMHLNRGHDAGGNTQAFERILKGERIDDGCEHPHVIASNAIHVVGGRSDASKNIASAENEPYLHALSAPRRRPRPPASSRDRDPIRRKEGRRELHR